MEIEGSKPVAAKKLWNIVRVLFFMLRKGIANSKLALHFHSLLKRGKLALHTLIMHHYAPAAASFITPRTHYEFSCTNSPAIPNFKRPKHNYFTPSSQYEKVLEILNNNDKVDQPAAATINSPSVTLPGFGNSPLGIRQLRVTDSPFPLNNDDGDCRIDAAAEEFINKFYRDLNLQKRSIADSPAYHNYYSSSSSWER